MHVPGITHPMLDYHAFRQCQTAGMARNYFRHGMHFFTPEIDFEGPTLWTGTEFPLYSYLLAGLYQVFGLHEILGRLISIFFTAWSALFLFGFIRRRLGDAAGFWSAIIMCAIPAHVYFTRTVQPESMALWGFLGFLYFFDRWLNDRRPADWIGAVTCGALSALLKLPFLYLVVGMWFFLKQWSFPAVVGGKSTIDPRPATAGDDVALWAALCVIVALTASWYAYARRAPHQVLPLGIEEHLKNLAPLRQWKFWEAHFISRFPEICATYSGLVLGIVGAGVFRRRREWIYFAWFAVTVLYTVLLGQYGWTHKYTDIPWAPVNAVFIAVGVLDLWRRAAASKALRALVIVLVVGIPVHAALRIAHWYRLDRLWLFRAHDVFARLSRSDDLVFTNTNEVPVFLYYIDRSGYAVNLNEATPAQVEPLMAQVKFLLVSCENVWPHDPAWQAFVDHRTHLVYQDPKFKIYRIFS